MTKTSTGNDSSIETSSFINSGENATASIDLQVTIETSVLVELSTEKRTVKNTVENEKGMIWLG